MAITWEVVVRRSDSSRRPARGGDAVSDQGLKLRQRVSRRRRHLADRQTTMSSRQRMPAMGVPAWCSGGVSIVAARPACSRRRESTWTAPTDWQLRQGKWFCGEAEQIRGEDDAKTWRRRGRPRACAASGEASPRVGWGKGCPTRPRGRAWRRRRGAVWNRTAQP